MKRGTALASLGCILVLAMAARAEQGPPHFPADRPLDVRHIKLDARVDLKAKTFDSVATLEFSALRDVETIRLNAVNFAVRGVRVTTDGSEPTRCDYENDGEHLTIMLPRKLATGQSATVEIEYRVEDPQAGLSFFAPKPSDPEVPYLMWSQGQAITNRYWVPCFDHPNERQTTEIICRVDAPNIAISNGKMIEQRDNGDGTRTFHWKQDQPHVAYLMTLVVGEFYVEEETWRGRPVTYYVREKYKDRIKNSFAHTTKMLDFFSDKIGVEYPWPKYAQVCCYGFGGGMENTSATTLTERTLHDDRAHLDEDSDGLVAHELAHQWWGDLLTCKEWAHIWLNEGFASYFEALWDEEALGADEFAWNMRGKARGAIEGGKTRPIVERNYKDPDEQFDSRAYPKGAWVLHMIRRRLGDELFWKMLNTYATRHQYQTVETSDLRRAIEDLTGRSFERFFYDWTERPGAPEVNVTYTWNAEESFAEVRVQQRQKDDAFHFPLALEFVFDGKSPPKRITRDVTTKDVTWLLPLASRPRMVRVDPEFAVLMTLTEEKPRDCWEAQLSDDPSVLGRARAVDYFKKKGTAQDAALLAARLMNEPYYGVQSTIAEALGELQGDVARDALLAGLKIKNPKARRTVVTALGRFSEEPDVTNAIEELVTVGDPSYRVEAAAIEAYAALSDEPVEFLCDLLDRESDDEIIREAVLSSIGKYGDYQDAHVLIEWSKPGSPHACRAAAARALGEMFSSGTLDDHPEAQEMAIDALRDCLKETPRNVQNAALGALAAAGDKARPALRDIEQLTRTGLLRVRSAAERTLKAIREKTPAKLEWEDLREELEALREEKGELIKRIELLEAKLSPEAGNAAKHANSKGAASKINNAATQSDSKPDKPGTNKGRAKTSPDSDRPVVGH
ncbi:MAG: aminopeptidase [Phycisphaerae bacterium]|nr:MAG: M1 family metallopeptidase [Planctomycetia bacterium]RIK67373.1 MAG: hypothetical protein DCC66_11790 [Planctomycetota bacterium]GJQ27552.1 MAG: aminopeptidase [Phycisphaerae bacterium]